MHIQYLLDIFTLMFMYNIPECNALEVTFSQKLRFFFSLGGGGGGGGVI